MEDLTRKAWNAARHPRSTASSAVEVVAATAMTGAQIAQSGARAAVTRAARITGMVTQRQPMDTVRPVEEHTSKAAQPAPQRVPRQPVPNVVTEPKAADKRLGEHGAGRVDDEMDLGVGEIPSVEDLDVETPVGTTGAG